MNHKSLRQHDLQLTPEALSARTPFPWVTYHPMHAYRPFIISLPRKRKREFGSNSRPEPPARFDCAGSSARLGRHCEPFGLGIDDLATPRFLLADQFLGQGLELAFD